MAGRVGCCEHGHFVAVRPCCHLSVLAARRGDRGDRHIAADRHLPTAVRRRSQVRALTQTRGPAPFHALRSTPLYILCNPERSV